MSAHDAVREHLRNFLGNLGQVDASRQADALLDPVRHGPLVDPEFVVGLVALIDDLGLMWPQPPPLIGVPSHPVYASVTHRLRLVRHPHADPLVVDL